MPVKHRSLLTLAGGIELVKALNARTLLAAEQTTDFGNSVPVKGMVTMIDLGADKSTPCKAMAPIIKTR